MAIFKKVMFFVLLAVSFFFLYLSYDLERKNPSPVPLLPIPTMFSPTATSAPVPASHTSSSIFVPYWALEQDGLESIPYDTIYYFGVSAGKNGVNTDDPGYRGMERAECPDVKKCVLVLRMLDSEISTYVLSNKESQKLLIEDVLRLVNGYSYSGVALDLEISGLTDIGTRDNINEFVNNISSFIKKNYKTFSFITYGDVYYRNRPYDMKSIGTASDEVLIMAYDFHKSYGEPGPNFPFDRRSKKMQDGEDDQVDYGYDFKQMVSDFSGDVQKSKLTVIFGMYGYDWVLNAQGTPLKRATAISGHEIENLLENRQLRTIVNPTSKEKKATYEDVSGKHILWFEDEESAMVKTEYLREQGIGSVSFWAYGYF